MRRWSGLGVTCACCRRGRGRASSPAIDCSPYLPPEISLHPALKLVLWHFAESRACGIAFCHGTVSIEGETAMSYADLYSRVGPKLKGPLPGPKARAAVAHDDSVISPSYTRSYPLVAKSGKGVRITDVDGNEFLDFAAGIAVNSTGDCHPEVVAAIQKQAAELIRISGTDFY